MVIGGSDIFAATMRWPIRLEITHVHASPDGDAMFPPIDDEIWQEASREEHFGRPDDDADFSFATYIRR
jgi:dihydrofolate reductase